MRLFFLFFFLIFQVMPAQFLFAQKSDDYQRFSNLSLGTEASIIGCFLQDAQGMIWIGSNKGLYSYDGYSTQSHFQFGDRSNTRIYCGAVIDSTYLYMGADNGLLIYNCRLDAYEEPDVNFPKDIRTLALQGNVLWLGTLNGLYTYQLNTRKLSPVTKGIPHQTIYSIITASDGNVYIGTYNGFCRYNSKNRKVEVTRLPVIGNKSNQFVNSLLEDSMHHCIWIGTEGNLFKYRLDNGQVEQIAPFLNNSVKSLALDGLGRLLVGTDNGLYVYKEREQLLHLLHDSRNLQSLCNNIIWTVFRDREQNIWLGTDYGISVSLYNSILQYIPISQITGTGEGNQFYTMLRDSRGIHWFGGTNGLIRFSTLEGQNQKVIWYKMGDKQYPLSHNHVRCLYEDKDHQLWAATDGSISRYDYEKRQFIHYNIVDSTYRYNANWAYSLFEAPDNRLWIATCLGGIFVVDKQKLMLSSGGRYVAEKTYTVDDGLSGMFISKIVPDKHGNVWALLYNSPNSIEKINVRTGKVTHPIVKGLKDNQKPETLLCDQGGLIWIGFSGGVACVNPVTNQSRILLFDIYNHNEVLAMAEAENRIWISTTDGFWMVDRSTLKVRRLNMTDKRFTGIFFDSPNHLFYLGTADGFALSSPEALLAEYPERKLILTALYVNNQLWVPNVKRGEQSIRVSKRIELTYKQNNLAFEVSDLPYSLGEKNKFVYRLEGVDQEWNFLKPNSNRITYNNLSYGSYRLLIDNLSEGGTPSSHPYFLDIHITPPWYYTVWAKGFYAVLCLVLILWTINFFRVKSRLRLERLEKKKVLEQSRMKMEFFTNLSHDLKTPLSMIIAPISKMLPEIKNLQEKLQLEQVHRNAMKLNSLIHSGLDFNRVDSGNNALLIVSKIELVAFARSLFSLYADEKVSGEKQLSFDFQTNKDKIYVQMDAIKLESILDNLLSNAVKYTLNGGTVSLILNEQENGKDIHIAVMDTGIGILPCDQPYVFQRFFQSSRTSGKKEGTGIGLYLVKTYTELHGGDVSLVSEEGKGTTVVLNLPVGDKSQESIITCNDDKTEEKDAPLVLVVDDNREISEFIIQILQAKYRCQLAENGKAGLELCMKLLPDLVIADIMMPVMDGLEMVGRIKKNIPTSTIPVILLTAKSDKDTELESIRMHVDAFISKPFEPDILLFRVEQLINASRKYEEKVRLEVIATPERIEAVSYDEKVLANVTHLIEEHISDSELNVNALCGWADLNNKQLYRKIKQLTGMTPVDYIKSIRMKKAAMLLKQQKFTVAEVMYMVGFSNHSYFSKCFQQEFGLTPKQYQTGG